jgi:threonine/homoserine/homoserine lactone efflux protein
VFVVFAKSLVIGYSGAVMPGSLLAYVVDKSMRKGAMAGILATVGHALLELALVLALIFGAGKIISSDPVQIVTGVAGGLFLCWMSYSMIRDSTKDELVIKGATGGDDRDNPMVRGAVLSGTNPYFLLWWTVVGIGLISEAYALFGILGAILFYIGHITADLTWYGLVSFIVSKTRRFMNMKRYRVFAGVLGIAVLGLGISFIVRALLMI